MIYRNKSPLLSNLPDELLLIILENLQPHDLWSMSQTSKRFVQMPDAILMRKFFKQCTVRFSWCCTFCLIQAAPPPSLSNIVPLFQSSQLEVTEPQGLWNEVKAFVMETTILTFFDEWECQRCNLAIGSVHPTPHQRSLQAPNKQAYISSERETPVSEVFLLRAPESEE